MIGFVTKIPNHSNTSARHDWYKNKPVESLTTLELCCSQNTPQKPHQKNKTKHSKIIARKAVRTPALQLEFQHYSTTGSLVVFVLFKNTEFKKATEFSYIVTTSTATNFQQNCNLISENVLKYIFIHQFDTLC